MPHKEMHLKKRRGGFTLIEILFALLLSGLLLASGFFLLDGIIRSLEARTSSVWDRIESARLERFFQTHLQEPAQQGKIEWSPVGNDPESASFDWILRITRPETMLARTEEGRSVLPEIMEIGWQPSKGLMIREQGPEGIPSDPLPFRPLLAENPFSDVLLYRLTERNDYIEMDPSETTGETNSPLPNIIHFKVSHEIDPNAGIWLFLTN